MRWVLIADDHEVTRRGIREVMCDAFDGVQVCEAFDADSALAQLDARPWDLILLDVFMPGSNVIELLAHVRAQKPTVPIIVLTAATELSYVSETMKAGANGFVRKQHASEDLVAAIRAVVAGHSYLHPETAGEVAASLGGPRAELPHDRLSPRELETFRLIALGKAVKEIAGELDVSDKTVATYLARIREKTGLTSYVEIARYALHNGLVD